MLDENFVRVIVGLIAVVVPLSRWLLPAARKPARSSLVRGSCWTSIGGYTSFVAHAGGPPILVYLMPLRLKKAVLVATNGVFFVYFNLIKLPLYAMLGQINSTNLGTALILCPLVPIGIKLGIWLQGKFSNEQFYRIGQICVFLTGSKLLFDGLRNPLIL